MIFEKKNIFFLSFKWHPFSKSKPFSLDLELRLDDSALRLNTRSFVIFYSKMLLFIVPLFFRERNEIYMLGALFLFRSILAMRKIVFNT